MRAGVYPNAGCLGRPWLLRLSSSQMESKCYSEQPVLCRGLCTGRPTAEGCVLAALCARERGAGCTVCAAGLQQSVQGSRGRSARKDGKTALILAAMADARDCPCLGCLRKGGRPARHKWLYCSDGGCAAQRHRSCQASVEEKPASRKTMAPQQHTSRILEALPWQDAVSL